MDKLCKRCHQKNERCQCSEPVWIPHYAPVPMSDYQADALVASVADSFSSVMDSVSDSSGFSGGDAGGGGAGGDW